MKTDDRGRDLELIDEEERTRLGHYFRNYLGDIPEADECVHETIRASPNC